MGKASWENAVWGAKVLFVSVIAFITDRAIDSEERLTDGRLLRTGDSDLT